MLFNYFPPIPTIHFIMGGKFYAGGEDSLDYQPKIGLALGAGAARGIAHLGVLKTLAKYKLQVDYIAGTSIGALVGALYACGLDVDFLIQFANELRAKSWVDLVLPRTGLISGKKVETMLQILTRNRCFDELKIPFAAVATDIERGEPVIIKEGNVAAAVRASISIPVIFKPVSMNGRLLVDGVSGAGDGGPLGNRRRCQ